MPTLAETRNHEARVHQLVTLALRDLSALYVALRTESPDVVRDTLLRVMPDAMTPYAAAIGDLSTLFYEDVRAEAKISSRYAPEPLEPPDKDRWAELVRWGVGPLYGQDGDTLELLGGGLQKRLSNVARDTIYANAQRDPATVRYQRVPASGCCSFCGLMASRGAVYTSQQTATTVGGRGMPVEKTKGKRGGQAKGITVRGTQPRGAKFHDHCRCGVAPVFEGQEQELPADVQLYADAYANTTPGADLKTALSEMRTQLGTR